MWDLWDSCRDGNVHAVKEALKCGINPRRYDNYAIQLACSYGHVNVLNILLQDGRADPAACDRAFTTSK